MKRLDEILSRRSVSATSAGPSATSSGTAEPGPEPSPACPICGGAGFVRRKREIDDPLFGRAEPCDCVLVETADTRLRRLDLRYGEQCTP